MEFYQKVKIQEFKNELNDKRKDKNYANLKLNLKKVLTNITMGYDLSPLFKDVLQYIIIKDIQVKKLVYFYLIAYGKQRQDLIHHPINHLLNDCADRNPLVRSLSLRTMSNIHLPVVSRSLLDPLRHCLSDADPYVRKTAAIAVAKIWFNNPQLVEKEGLIRYLRDLLADSNASVVANSVTALNEIAEKSTNISLKLNITIANRLISSLGECSEWSQIYLLESLLHFTPENSQDATILVERISSRLQHSNSAVVVTSTKIILYLFNYIKDESVINFYCNKLSPPLITLLSSPPEVQYVALRNILLIIQRRPVILKNDVKVFFVKYLDPIYVKLAKLEIIYRLANQNNYEEILTELVEYATEIDVDFVKKAIKLIGRLAIKIESASDACVRSLLDLLNNDITYVTQEVIIVFRDIFRKYPNRYDNYIPDLTSNLDAITDSEAKSSMIWIIGECADKIPNSNELLDDFLWNFIDETSDVQLSLLTATVKLFIKTPHQGQDLVPRVLNWATQDIDNPDLRDRAFLYWRLLSNDPNAAKDIILSSKPTISTEVDKMDRSLLDSLLLHVGSLSSIYHKQPSAFIRGAKPRYLPDSPALDSYSRRAAQAAAARHDHPTPLPSVPSPEHPTEESPVGITQSPTSMRPVSVVDNINPSDSSARHNLAADISRMSIIDSMSPSPSQTMYSPTSPVTPGAYTPLSEANTGGDVYNNDPSNPYAALGDAFDDSPVLHSSDTQLDEFLI
ncbi:Adaptor protein complex beta subunit [Wallemia mellicola]|nr:Adaptor protein complex beta subunit [Wallemia mellicola]